MRSAAAQAPQWVWYLAVWSRGDNGRALAPLACLCGWRRARRWRRCDDSKGTRDSPVGLDMPEGEGDKFVELSEFVQALFTSPNGD